MNWLLSLTNWQIAPVSLNLCVLDEWSKKYIKKSRMPMCSNPDHDNSHVSITSSSVPTY
jgi:hypothetical protein